MALVDARSLGSAAGLTVLLSIQVVKEVVQDLVDDKAVLKDVVLLCFYPYYLGAFGLVQSVDDVILLPF